MLSKLTIDLDEDNQPIIRVKYRKSEDVRDTMVKRFIETLGYQSMYARIIFETPSHTIYDEDKDLKIRPIPSDKLTDTILQIQSITKDQIL